MNGKEINNRAAQIADIATEILIKDGIQNASVVVTYGPYYDWPLSIRTPMEDGFGSEEKGFPRLFRELLEESRLQAMYAQVAGRSAKDQISKLNDSNRSAASYGETFYSELKPNYAIDPDSDLTVVVACKGVDEKNTTELSKEVISKVNEHYIPEWTNARYLLNTCLGNLNQQLPKDRTGFSIIALPKTRADFFTNNEGKSIVVCSQSDGEVVKPANFAIVKAKTNAVFQSGKASGPEQDISLSRIIGAVPISIPKHGERIIAAGGLVEGLDDVNAIVSALKLFSPRMQISILEQLTRNSSPRIV